MPQISLQAIYSRVEIIANPKCRVRRKQLPLNNADISTIHTALGRTVDGVVTKISVQDSQYQLWERPMFLVIISRVRTLKNLKFVGSVSDPPDYIKQMLNMKCKQRLRVEKLIENKEVTCGSSDRIMGQSDF